jgi:hypothetical protein
MARALNPEGDEEAEEEASLALAARQFEYAIHNKGTLVQLECLTSGGFLTGRDGVVCVESAVSQDDPASKWRIIPAIPSAEVAEYGLRCEASRDYLGRNLLGQIVARSPEIRTWERFQLEFQSSKGSISVINSEWNFSKGAYLIPSASLEGQLVCSAYQPAHQKDSGSNAASFSLHLVEKDCIEKCSSPTKATLGESGSTEGVDECTNPALEESSLEKRISINRGGLLSAFVFSILCAVFGYLVLPDSS